MNNSFYQIQKLENSIYNIKGEPVAKYLIVGSHHALLFDTGYGFENLKEYIQTITDLPLYVVNSHGHIDHTGGNYNFDKCYMHQDDIEVYKRHQSKEMRKIAWDLLSKAQKLLFFWHIVIPKGYKEEKYLNNSLCENIIPIKEGDIFDLGGITLRVIEIPGHTSGSIGLYCKEKRLFFSGDGMNNETWMFLLESTMLSVYIESIKKVRQLIFDYMYTGHNVKPEPKSVLDDYLDVAVNLNYANGKKQKENLFAPGVIYKVCGSTNKDIKTRIAISQNKIGQLLE